MKKQGYKYTVVYEHFKKMIGEGALRAGDRLPSLLACSKELSVSKTTVETAYFQLAADGYIISKDKSGFYVTRRVVGRESYAGKTTSGTTSLAGHSPHENKEPHRSMEPTGMASQGKKILQAGPDTMADESVHFDLSRIGDDPSSFRFDLWQRYLKSAIRHRDRMATFGEAQGERDLREAICDYVRRQRSIYCSPEQIVIGASTQSLLMLLLTMLMEKGMKTASVPARGFERYAQIFQSRGLKVGIRQKEADIIYVSPSHMTVWGEVMSLNRRLEILEHSRRGHLIIEDDYQNEMVFSRQHCPSIYALSGGENVVYLGSFSRLLLPSIRISFMILPRSLTGVYQELNGLYDQTASKTEQIALCSYLRDNHIYSQIRRLRRTYKVKRALLYEILMLLCQGLPGLTVFSGESGTEMAIFGSPDAAELLKERLSGLGIACKKMELTYEMSEHSPGELMLFSCGVISEEALTALRDLCILSYNRVNLVK